VTSVVDPSSIRIAPLTRAYAEDIASWRYEPPYDVYDMTGAAPDYLLDPELGFHAVLAGDRLVGFRSFGPDGRVPGWDYDDSALDTGGGLRPSLTGQGLGRSVIAAGLDFGRSRFAPAAFRVTVASFNARARRTVESLGFEVIGSFAANRDGRPFDVLVRDETR
jgi:ribosomal-protein-alanine N-acetyltransferase